MTDAELLAEIEQVTKATPTRGESFARGAAQGATLGFGDEAAGGVAALQSTAQAPWQRTPGPHALARLYPGMPYAEAAARWFEENRPDAAAASAAEQGRQQAPEAYTAERDKQRGSNEEARAAHSRYYLGGQIAGSAVPAALTGGAGITGAAGLGAVQGLGYSDADSGRGLAGDTALGAALGLAGHGVGKALGSAASGVASFAKNRLARALAKQTAEAAEAKASALQSASGSLGKATAEQNRVVEGIRFLMQEPNLTPAQREILLSYQGSPEYAAAVEGLIPSLGKRLSENAGKIKQAEVGMEAVRSSKPVAEMASEGVSPKAAWERAIKPRLLRYGPVAAGTVAGAVFGGPVGTGIGALAGAGTRPMIRSLIRGAKDPALQTMLMKPLLGAGEAGASEGGRVLTQSLARSAAGVAPVGSLADYLSKSPEDRAAEAELERLLRE